MLSNVLKYLLGFILAIAVLIGGGFATGLYLINRTAIAPKKPIFNNDDPAVRAQAAASPEAGATLTPETVVKANATPTPKPSPTVTAAVKTLPPGAYVARVTWPQGLSLRAEAKQEAERVGGAGFNEKVIVLQESDDKVWQKIRLKNSDKEGWVKTRNTERTDDKIDSLATDAEKPQ